MSDSWFEAFRRGPERVVADLFSGRAGAGSDLRLDVPELLYQQFPPSLADERAAARRRARVLVFRHARGLRLPSAAPRFFRLWQAGRRCAGRSAVTRSAADQESNSCGHRRLAALAVAVEVGSGAGSRAGVLPAVDPGPARRPPHGPVVAPRRRPPAGVPDRGVGRAAVAAEPRQCAEESGADVAGAAAPCRQDPPRRRCGTHLLQPPLCSTARPFPTRPPALEPGPVRGAGWFSGAPGRSD